MSEERKLFALLGEAASRFRTLGAEMRGRGDPRAGDAEVLADVMGELEAEHRRADAEAAAAMADLSATIGDQYRLGVEMTDKLAEAVRVIARLREEREAAWDHGRNLEEHRDAASAARDEVLDALALKSSEVDSLREELRAVTAQRDGSNAAYDKQAAALAETVRRLRMVESDFRELGKVVVALRRLRVAGPAARPLDIPEPAHCTGGYKPKQLSPYRVEFSTGDGRCYAAQQGIYPGNRYLVRTWTSRVDETSIAVRDRNELVALAGALLLVAGHPAAPAWPAGHPPDTRPEPETPPGEPAAGS